MLSEPATCFVCLAPKLSTTGIHANSRLRVSILARLLGLTVWQAILRVPWFLP
jgi:hypothetical protein